jgi:hypothetical protein
VVLISVCGRHHSRCSLAGQVHRGLASLQAADDVRVQGAQVGDAVGGGLRQLAPDVQHAQHAGACLGVAQPRLDGGESQGAQAARALQSGGGRRQDAQTGP